MKYIKLYEELSDSQLESEKLLNTKLIKDVKDMALEYLDDYYILNIQVFIRNDNMLKVKALADPHKIFTCRFSHGSYLEWEHPIIDQFKYEKKHYNIVLWSMPQYAMRAIYARDKIENIKISVKNEELLNRVKEAYPDESITNFQFPLSWGYTGL